MTSLSPAAEIEFRDRVWRVHPVVEMTLGGTVYRFAEEAVASESEGLYLPYVTDFGDTTRAANVSEFSLEIPRFQFSIFDRDRVLQKLFGGPLRGAVRNSHVETWWRGFELAAADHYMDFSGVILDYEIRDRVFSFSCSADVGDLEAPLKIPLVPEEDWPDAPEDTIGAPLWVVLGRNISIGVADSHGMIACLPFVEQVSGNVDVWGASLGANASVPRVYFDEALRTSDFTVSKVQRGKNYYTILTYTGGNPHPAKDSEIRCDINGLTTLPNGTGTLITNPARQMRYAMKIFGYGDGDVRPLAAWPSESGMPIASGVFDDAENFYRIRNWEGAMVLFSGQKLSEVFRQWCDSFNAAPFFDDTWGVGAMPLDNGESTLYYDDRHVAQKLQHAKSELGLSTERQDPITDLEVEYLYDQARGTFARSSLVAWRRLGVKIVPADHAQTHGRRAIT